MFFRLSGRLRPAVFAALLSGLSVSPTVLAGAQECFNFLNAQDYARAETEAQALLQRSDLDRAEQHGVRLCQGRAYYNMGRSREALSAFQQVEALSQTTEELSVAYSWLGTVYYYLGDLDRAELYLSRGLKAFRKLSDKSREASALNNLAGVAAQRGDVERALRLYRESLALQPNEAKKSAAMNSIALIHADRKEYAKAVKLLRDAIEIDRRNGDVHETAIHQLSLGRVLRQQGKPKAAEKELIDGYSAIKLVGDKRWEASTCLRFAELALEQKSAPLGRWAAMGANGIRRPRRCIARSAIRWPRMPSLIGWRGGEVRYEY